MVRKPQFRLGLGAFVFATALAVSLYLAETRGLLGLDKGSVGALVLSVAVAALLALAGGGYGLILRFGRQRWRRFLARRMLAALQEYEEQKLACTSIAERQGSLTMILAAGQSSGLVQGVELMVDNPAGGRLGRLVVLETQPGSALCGVADRVEPVFWDELENRMKADFSPPLGVVITRRLAPTIVNEIEGLLESWSEGV